MKIEFTLCVTLHLPMLEGLDKVDWENLGHAYGPASDVPALIRGLASTDASTREKAIYELYGNIWHQGTVYEATAQAVPFLIELLEAGSVQDKHQILILLAHLATGTSYKDVHQHMGLFREQVETPEWQAELQQELKWVNNAKDAVAQGFPVYRHLLLHPEPAVRDATAYLLASISEAAKGLTEEIFRRLVAEDDDAVKSSLVRAFGLVGKDNEQTQERILTLLSSEQPKAVQLAAAMALVGIVRAAAPQQAVAVLLDALQNPDSYSALERSCWQEGETVASTLSRYMATLEGPPALAAEDALIRVLGSEKMFHATAVAEALLQLAFQGPLDSGTMMNALNERQRKVLHAFAATPNLWGREVKGSFYENGNTGSLMRSYNLPGRLQDFQAFVHGEGTAKK